MPPPFRTSSGAKKDGSSMSELVVRVLTGSELIAAPNPQDLRLLSERTPHSSLYCYTTMKVHI
jgi:hypothetical protein